MTKNSNEIQIRTLVENWAKAVREGEIDSVLANHTDDIVIFVSGLAHPDFLVEMTPLRSFRIRSLKIQKTTIWILPTEK